MIMKNKDFDSFNNDRINADNFFDKRVFKNTKKKD